MNNNHLRGGGGGLPFEYGQPGNLSHRSNPSNATTIIGGDIAAKMTTYKRAYAGNLDEEINQQRGIGTFSTNQHSLPPNQKD